jgi:hypothetical protein
MFDRVDVAAQQQVDHGLVPFGIERGKRACGRAVDLSGGLAGLSRGARFGRGIASGDQEFAHDGRR